MSFHLSIAALALLTLTATAQAQQDRRFSALVPQPSYVTANHRGSVANPDAYDQSRSRGNFGSFSAASVVRTLGY